MYEEDYNEEEDLLQNSTDYSPKSEFSKASIVQQAILKTRESRGKEMREGYYNYKYDSQGNEIKIWIPDARQIFCSNVEGDIDILAPEISSDKDTSKAFEEFEKMKLELKEKYIYHEKQKRKFSDGNRWVNTDRKFLPKIGEGLLIDNPNKPKSCETIIYKGLWDNKINAYWDEMVEIHDLIFRQYNILIHKLNYFKSGKRYG